MLDKIERYFYSQECNSVSFDSAKKRRLRYPSKTHVKQTFCENWLALTYFIICPEHGSYFHNSQNDCDTEINIVGDRHLTRFDLNDLLRIFVYCNSSGWMVGWRCGKLRGYTTNFLIAYTLKQSVSIYPKPRHMFVWIPLIVFATYCWTFFYTKLWHPLLLNWTEKSTVAHTILRRIA